MKQFASTLYFCSPKAYKYVRSELHSMFHLPHPSTIRQWTSKLKNEPGYIEKVFTYLKNNINDKPWLKDCNLVIDLIALHKQILFDKSGGKYSGYIHCRDIVGNGKELASEALVIILVSLKNKFKCPVAYFLINKISADIQCQMINCCLSKLHEVGIKVCGLKCDGTATNVQTVKKLEVELGVSLTNTHFVHSEMDKVYVIFYACHMLKLARNILSDK